MIDIRSPWKSATDRGKWAARGASFVVKVKATKAVWFPPKPEQTGKKTTGAAKKTTKKTTGAAKKTGKKTTGTAKKTAGTAKNTTGG